MAESRYVFDKLRVDRECHKGLKQDIILCGTIMTLICVTYFYLYESCLLLLNVMPSSEVIGDRYHLVTETTTSGEWTLRGWSVLIGPVFVGSFNAR